MLKSYYCNGHCHIMRADCEKIFSFNWPQIRSKSLPDSYWILPDFYWIVFKQFCPKNPPFSVISSKLAFLWFCAISRNFYQNRKLTYFKSISFSCQKLEIFTFYVKPTDQSFPIKGQSCQIWPQLISPCCWGNISRNIPWQFY